MKKTKQPDLNKPGERPEWKRYHFWMPRELLAAAKQYAAEQESVRGRRVTIKEVLCTALAVYIGRGDLIEDFIPESALVHDERWMEIEREELMEKQRRSKKRPRKKQY